MRARVAFIVAALIALAAGLVVALQPSDDAPAPVRFGFNNNAVTQGIATPEQAAQLIASMGAEIDRVQIDWVTLEPEQGDYRFGPYDAIYSADLHAGIKPLFIFAFAPAWATDAPCASAATPCHAPPSPEHFADAASTAAVIAKRYPKAAGIEIWNEPNAAFFWAPTPDPAAYSDLLAACFDAIKHVDSSMPVAGGSTSDTPGVTPGDIRAPDFVAGMKAAGAFAHMDALSLHAYPEPADPSTRTATDSVDAVEDVIGDAHIPIWITETGATTTGPDAVSEQVQALMADRLTDSLADLPRVQMVLFHTLIEPPFGDDNPETGFGILHTDASPKPAFCTLSRDWGGDASC